jgi:hypothetical protein
MPDILRRCTRIRVHLHILYFGARLTRFLQERRCAGETAQAEWMHAEGFCVSFRVMTHKTVVGYANGGRKLDEVGRLESYTIM